MSQAVLAGVLVLLAGGSLVSLARFYDAAVRDGRTNDRLLANYAILKAARAPDEAIVIDRALMRDWTLTEGRLARVVGQWLDLDSVPSAGIELLPDGRFSGGWSDVGGLAVLACGSLDRASQAYQLDELASDRAPEAPADRGYVVVRAAPHAR